MDDPYKILGVEKTATEAEIKKAYRELAKKLHPDLNPNDKAAEARFKDVSAAFDIIGDKEKRARYDAGEIDASGAERPQQHYYKDFAGGPEARQYGSQADMEDIGGIFSEIFGRGQTGDARQFSMRGRDVRYHLAIDFLDAVKGATKRISMPDGSSLDVKVPEGVRAGQMIRLRGKGQPGSGGGASGDAIIEIEVRPHKVFSREEEDILIELPISIDEAILGSKVDVQTISGRVRVTIPKGASSGQTLKLKGKGVKGKSATGDQLCILKIVLPDTIDSDLETFMTNWRETHAYDPRQPK